MQHPPHLPSPPSPYAYACPRPLRRTLSLILALALAPTPSLAEPDASRPPKAQRPDAGPPPTASSDVTLRAVLANLSRIQALSARFREEKRMALLAQPLVSEGALYYEQPRLLARHSERPHPSSLVLRGDVLTFGDAQRSESIELSSQPALRILVETFVSVLAGDLAALERAADVSVESTGAGFRIRVTPKDPKVKRLVRSMAFEGEGALLSRMELVDATGDTTLTTFSRVTLRQPFSAGERARLFRVGG